MDTARFDALARILGRTGSRRTGLRAIAAAVLAPVVARARPAAAEVCENDDLCCHCRTNSGQCVYWEGKYLGCCGITNTICGAMCCPPGQPCIPPIPGDPNFAAGGCCPPSSTLCGTRTCCGEGYSCCNGTHCCQDGIEECVEGSCRFPCPPGRTRCGTACCPEGQVCDQNQCVSQCPSGTTSCGHRCCSGNQRCQDNSCVAGVVCNPATEVQCNDRCCQKDGQVCCFGSGPGSTCCATGTRCCAGGGGATCCGSDTHCCDGRCCPDHQTCEGGLCLDDCPNGRHRCGNACCPAGMVCERTGPGGGAVCAPCPAGQANCGGRCKNLKSDEDNCGTCGKQCRKKQKCRKGRCRRK